MTKLAFSYSTHGKARRLSRSRGKSATSEA